MPTTPVTSSDLVNHPELGRSLAPPAVEAEALIHRGALKRPNPGIANRLAAERGHPTLPIAVPSELNAYLLGFLGPGEAAHMHRHTYESVLLILQGRGHSLIEGTRVAWEAGDVLFTPRWAWHTHVNDGEDDVIYVSVTNMPQVANLGLMLREEPHRDRLAPPEEA